MKRSAILILLLLGVVGCGGGSAGTGTDSSSFRSFEGVLRDSIAQPVAGARITLLNTGDSVITGNQGEFEIPTDFLGGDAVLEFDLVETLSRATIPRINTDRSTVRIEATLNSSNRVTSLEHIEVLVQMVGLCDFYFENFRTIRQANKVPPNTTCTLKYWLSQSGVPLNNLPVSLYSRTCPKDGATTLLGTAVTGATGESGIAKISFPFADSDAQCVYVAVAPVQQQLELQVVYEVHTFHKQRIQNSDDGILGNPRTDQ